MRFIFVLIVILIGYGSLYPFNFHEAHLSNINFLQWLFNWEHRTTRGDILGNVLLFIPFGFFGALSLRKQLQKNFWFWSLLFIVSGVSYALFLQVLQIYLPSRVSTSGDALFNLLGLMLGFCFSVFIASRHLAHWLDNDNLVAHLSIPLILCICWLSYQLFPFIPSLDFQEIKNSIKASINLRSLNLWDITDRLILWTVFWYCLDKTHLIKINTWKAIGFLVGLYVIELLIMHNHMSLNSLIAGLCSCFIIFKLNRIPHQWLTLLLICLIVVRGLYPFHFRDDAVVFQWMPFIGFLEGSMWRNSYVLFEKLFIYGAAYYVMTEWIGDKRKSILWISCILLIIEILQVWIINRTPEITDPILAILMGVGFMRLSHVSKRKTLLGV